MKRLRIWRRWFARRIGYARLVCLVLLIGFAVLRVADPAPVEEIRVRTFDTFQRLDPRAKLAKSPVAVVDIDDQSLTKLGQWPWPRTRIADMITNLTKLGAAVIAFDVVFSEPDRLNPDIAADTFRNLDEETRAKLRSLPSNDQVFADAIRRSRVVLGESGIPVILSDLDKSLPVTGLAMLGEEPQPFMLEWLGLLRNVPVLEAAAAGRGLFSIRPERDGIVRRVPMIMLAQGVTMPSLSFEMLRVATGTDTIFIKADKGGIKSIGVKGFQIPTDANGQLWVHFARRDTSILCARGGCARWQRAARKNQGQIGVDRNLGGGAQRHQDHAGVPGHAGRRDPRPGARKRADPGGAFAAELRHRPGIPCRAGARNSGAHLRADVRSSHSRRHGRAVRHGVDRNVLVLSIRTTGC